MADGVNDLVWGMSGTQWTVVGAALTAVFGLAGWVRIAKKKTRAAIAQQREAQRSKDQAIEDGINGRVEAEREARRRGDRGVHAMYDQHRKDDPNFGFPPDSD